MSKEPIKIKKVYLNWIVLGLILLIALLIVFPFAQSIISGYILAFLLLPLFKFFNRYMNRSLSALLCIFLVLVVIVVPLFFIVNQLVNEANSLSQNIDFGSINIPGGDEIKSQITSSLSNMAGNIIRSFPSVFITLLVTFFGLFYFLYDWDKIRGFLYRKIPLENKKELFDDVGKTTKKITYGLLLVGTIEFVIAFLGFTISGVEFPFLFALMIGLLAFTLVLDPSIIWGPIVIVYFFVFGEKATALGALITGLILSTDTIFRPRIIGSASNINPFVMLLGVLGGISLFGLLGFIIGPVVLVFSLRLFKESFEVVN